MKATSWSDPLRERIAASEWGQKIWARYEVATPREQFATKIVGVVLALFLIAGLIVVPLHDYHRSARDAYRQQSETLAWMQANRAAAGSAGATVRPAGTSLLSLANQSARSAGLSFKRSEPVGASGLNVWMEKVPFNQVVSWLGQMEHDYGVVASELAASRRDEPGLVDVRVTLQD